MVQDALDSLQTSLQLIQDCCTTEAKEENDHAKMDLLLLYLEIDTRMRMAELGKSVGDSNTAQEEFQHIIKLCEKYPTNNESMLTSALF